MTDLDAAVAAGMATRADLLADSPTQMVLPDEVLHRRMLEAALPLLVPPPGPDLTAVPWRHGGSHARSIYAEAGFSDGKPGSYVGHMDTGGLAAEAITAHNAMLDLQWLLDAGLDVQVAPCGGPGRCCGDTAGRFAVRAALPDPAADLSVPGGVESHGHASPGEALAFARAWSEREGISS